MRASKIGIEVTKSELNALLTFAGGGDRLDNVYFGVKRPRDKLVASATDGHRALEITTESDSDDHVVGEWSIARAFLEACGSVLDSEGLCVLLVTPGGLRRARIMDVESLAERATISWHEEAASTQVTMDALSEVIRLARFNVSHHGTWFALQGKYLAEMLVVSKACGKAPITMYPPRSPSEPVYFEATSDGAQWRGAIMPCTVTGPGGNLADDDEQPDDMKGRSVADAREALQRAADEIGGDISMSTTDESGKETKTVVAKARKGSKTPASAPASDDGVVDDDYKPEGAAKPKRASKAKAPAKPKKGKAT